MIKARCFTCSKEFTRKRSEVLRSKKTYCSCRCYYKARLGSKSGSWSEERRRKHSILMMGRSGHYVRTEEHKKRISEWSKGKTHTEEAKEKNRRAHLGENNSNWKGGITSIGKEIRNSRFYRDWRFAIFKRDGFTCMMCGEKRVRLNVDHYPKTFSQIMEQFNIKTLDQALECSAFWDVENNRTLCEDCHKLTPTYGRGSRGLLHKFLAE